MPREITHHDSILEAIGRSGIISELVEKHEGHYKYELDLEVILYGRNYAGNKVGPYVRLLVYGPGEKIIREGKWGGNAFYILVEGMLDVYVNEAEGGTRKIGKVQPQDPFGEMSMLSGQVSNATVVVSDEAEAKVLEIQRPALRLLRKLKRFGDKLDEKYRQHGLDRTMEEVQKATGEMQRPTLRLLRKLRTFGLLLYKNYRRHGLNRSLLKAQEPPPNSFTSELLTKFKDATRFTVYAKDHILFLEGDPIDKIIFIKNGWMRRVRGPASSLATARALASRPMLADTITKSYPDVGLDYLGDGNWLGLDAVVDKDHNTWPYSAIIMARTEVLEIEIARLRSNPALVSISNKHFQQFSDADNKPPEPPTDTRSVIALEEEIETGIVDGTNLLVMDMDLCIRCGNCSLACHKVHGHSRLLRRGRIHISRPVKPNSQAEQHVLSPSVCLHCQDPECLTGCPTGAIARHPEGYIDIHPQTCIGCGDCATQCPYNAISMIPRNPVVPPPPGLAGRLKSWLSLAPPKELSPVTETDDLLAVKCNLCENTPLNPKGAKSAAYSCQENCPTGALVRVNPREYFSEAKNSIGIVFRDQTHAIGRNIHKRDIPARIFHLCGVLAIIAITWAALWAARLYTMDGHLAGTWLTVRWGTGLIGLVSIAFVMTYPARKQIYRRRCGPLRYWMLAHVYVGLIAGIVLLIHGGRASGGLLTSLLMVSFDLVIVSGIFGIGCYLIVPRIMTSIEGDPLLIEDLRARREELRKTLGLIDTSDDQLRYLIKVKMRKRFFSLRYL
ncbi:MAG TPA: cyclic nucleotide-binding domain-containing protein, partial [Pyrinomonadaceae bacterium]|nr:cyclic nucleotide-binding domain-containing protein [Pyrinomonadaceae bacterium]